MNENGHEEEKIDASEQDLILVQKNGTKVMRKRVDANATTLSEFRKMLTRRGIIKDDDIFLAQDDYPIEKGEESSEQISGILSKENIIQICSPEDDEPAIKDDSSTPVPGAKGPLNEEDANLDIKMQRQEASFQIETDPYDKGASEGVNDSPLDLSRQNWKRLLKKNQLLSGLDMTEEIPRPSFKQATELRTTRPEFICHDTPTVSFVSTYSERVHARIRSGISKSEAGFSCPFFSISASHSQRTQESSQTTGKHLHMNALWNFPRVIINLSPEMVKSTKAFREEVKEALCNYCRTHNTDDEKKLCHPCPEKDAEPIEPNDHEATFSKLHQVLKKYGSVWPTQVTLGAQLIISDTHTLDASQTRKEKETSWQVGASAAYKGFTGSGGHGETDAGADETSNMDEFKSKIFTAKGGNTILGQDPVAWMKTVGQWNNWAVIERSNLIPLYQLLDQNYQDTIGKIMKGFKSLDFKVFLKHSQISLRKIHMELQVPEGYKIIGGGATISSHASANFFQSCMPDETLSKMTLVAGDVKVVIPATAVLYAIAIDDPENKWSVDIVGNETVADQDNHCQTVKLPEGYYVTGGGAQITHDGKIFDGSHAYLGSSYPVFENNQWGWRAKSHDCIFPTPHKLKAWAIGIKPNDERTVEHTVVTSRNEADEYLPEVSARLADDMTLIGGGADVDKNQGHFLIASYPDYHNRCLKAASRAIDKNAILTSYAIGMKNLNFVGSEVITNQTQKV